MKKLNQLICIFKGHTKLEKHTTYQSIYVQGGQRGPFCKNPGLFEYHGRLYRCERCGALLHQRGVTSWELRDIMEATLKQLPKISMAFAYQTYDFYNLFFRKKEN